MSILFQVVHIEEISPPQPTEAADMAKAIIQKLRPDGKSFSIQEFAFNPDPGQAWDIDKHYNLFHPSIPPEEIYIKYDNILLSYIEAEKKLEACLVGASEFSIIWKQRRNSRFWTEMPLSWYRLPSHG